MKLRDARPDEMRYVLATWVNSHLSRYPGRHRWQARKVHRAFLANLLEGQPCKIIVAATEPDCLHGWACAVPGQTLHYCYVPRELREEGLGRRLIQAAFGGYPGIIPCSTRWPFPSKRYEFRPLLHAAPPSNTALESHEKRRMGA